MEGRKKGAETRKNSAQNQPRRQAASQGQGGLVVGGSNFLATQRGGGNPAALARKRIRGKKRGGKGEGEEGKRKE